MSKTARWIAGIGIIAVTTLSIVLIVAFNRPPAPKTVTVTFPIPAETVPPVVPVVPAVSVETEETEDSVEPAEGEFLTAEVKFGQNYLFPVSQVETTIVRNPDLRGDGGKPIVNFNITLANKGTSAYKRSGESGFYGVGTLTVMSGNIEARSSDDPDTEGYNNGALPKWNYMDDADNESLWPGESITYVYYVEAFNPDDVVVWYTPDTQRDEVARFT